MTLTMSNAPRVAEMNIAEALTKQDALPALVKALDEYAHRYTKDIRDVASRILSATEQLADRSVDDFLAAARQQNADPDKAILDGLSLGQTKRVQALRSTLDSYLRLSETASKLFDIEGNNGPSRLDTERAMEALHPSMKRLAEDFVSSAT